MPDIEFGTAVVPIQPRHPQALAGQALTAQAATGGRLTLGIGLSHQFVVEHLWGLPFDRPVRHMREYLEALGPLLRGENSDVHGELVTSAGAIGVSDATAPSVLVAALGEQMLKVTGRLADGTITWCTGPKTLKDHIVPTIGAAAEAAGRPAPRIVASLPIVLTDDPAEAKAFVATSLEIYGTLPSYRAMLDREGAADPSDIAIVGNEEQAAAALAELDSRRGHRLRCRRDGPQPRRVGPHPGLPHLRSCSGGSDGAVGALPVLVPQQARVELAGGIAGQGLLEVDRAGHLVAGQVLAGEGQDLGLQLR